MDSRRLNLGLVSGLSAQAFGEPGQRTFRLLAQTSEGSVSLWLEKEQVVMLGGALDDLLGRLDPPRGTDPQVGDESTFVGELEVRVGSLALGYDGVRGGFTLEAGDFISQLPVDAIVLMADRSQVEGVRTQIDEIVAASRRRCPLCGTPLSEEPHFCPPSNGHASLREE